jgi:hypothetical protein
MHMALYWSPQKYNHEHNVGFLASGDLNFGK